METIIIDQGREFVNSMNDKLCDLLDIKHKQTSPYHPQAMSVLTRHWNVPWKNLLILDKLIGMFFLSMSSLSIEHLKIHPLRRKQDSSAPSCWKRQFDTKTFRYRWKKVSNRHRIFFQTNMIIFSKIKSTKI